MNQRILIWTQHLLGVGHFMRTAHIAQALAETGFTVVVASGGVTPPGFVARGYRLVELPAVQAKDELFDALVDARGDDVSRELLDARAQMLVSLHDTLQPDCVITETFPFGRRLVEDEVVALITRARASRQAPRIVSSVRDVLQRPRKTERAHAMVARARAWYDRILVHGDASIIPAELSFPELAAIKDLLVHTGYVGPRSTERLADRRDVLVSAGGGAVGQALVAAAVAAKPLTRLSGHDWIVVLGPRAAPQTLNVDGIRFVRSLPDLAERLADAVLSVSQAGYNTMTETLAGRTPCVAVPFETEREQEQITRALRLAELGLVSVVRACDLSPASLAKAIDARHEAGMPGHAINLDGVAGTIAAIRQLLGGV